MDKEESKDGVAFRVAYRLDAPTAAAHRAVINVKQHTLQTDVFQGRSLDKADVMDSRDGQEENEDGRCVGGVQNDMLIASTTRPETMFADVALAVHPDDARYNHLIGGSVIHPLLEFER